MKVFVADNAELGYKSPTNYHWCNNNDLLMFGQFQLEHNPSSVSMCGITSRKFTTHIIVKDLNISKEFYKELISDSVELAMNCKIQENGDYDVSVGFKMKFNINDIVNELLDKASEFETNQKIRCVGRMLYKVD